MAAIVMPFFIGDAEDMQRVIETVDYISDIYGITVDANWRELLENVRKALEEQGCSFGDYIQLLPPEEAKELLEKRIDRRLPFWSLDYAYIKSFVKEGSPVEAALDEIIRRELQISACVCFSFYDWGVLVVVLAGLKECDYNIEPNIFLLLHSVVTHLWLELPVGLARIHLPLRPAYFEFFLLIPKVNGSFMDGVSFAEQYKSVLLSLSYRLSLGGELFDGILEDFLCLRAQFRRENVVETTHLMLPLTTPENVDNLIEHFIKVITAFSNFDFSIYRELQEVYIQTDIQRAHALLLGGAIGEWLDVAQDLSCAHTGEAEVSFSERLKLLLRMRTRHHVIYKLLSSIWIHVESLLLRLSSIMNVVRRAERNLERLKADLKVRLAHYHIAKFNAGEELQEAMTDRHLVIKAIEERVELTKMTSEIAHESADALHRIVDNFINNRSIWLSTALAWTSIFLSLIFLLVAAFDIFNLVVIMPGRQVWLTLSLYILLLLAWVIVVGYIKMKSVPPPELPRLAINIRKVWTETAYVTNLLGALRLEALLPVVGSEERVEEKIAEHWHKLERRVSKWFSLLEKEKISPLSSLQMRIENNISIESLIHLSPPPDRLLIVFPRIFFLLRYKCIDFVRRALPFPVPPFLMKYEGQLREAIIYLARLAKAEFNEEDLIAAVSHARDMDERAALKLAETMPVEAFISIPDIRKAIRKLTVKQFIFLCKEIGISRRTVIKELL